MKIIDAIKNKFTPKTYNLNGKKIKIKNDQETKTTASSVITFVFLAIYALSLVLLLLWALMTSFKSQGDFRLNIIGLPKQFEWNYGFVFEHFTYTVFFEGYGNVGISVGYMFLYSILYAGGCAIVKAMTTCLTAYCCARYRYKFGNVVTFLVILAMTMPIVGALPAEIHLAKTLGLYDSIIGQYVMKMNFLGMYYLVFFAMFKSVPKEFDEAAKIDGAGDFTIMLKIVLPTIVPTLLTVTLLTFIGFWNDYQIPLIYLPHYPTISQGLQRMINTNLNDLSTVPMRMTASMIVLIPIFTIFVIFQKSLMGNVTIGGVKG
jgi:ABC-type glycerol-3-phosphate transport system permease component